MRVYRSWACPCCRREWTRRLGDTFAPECGPCGQTMIAARTPRTARVCKHRREAAAKRARAERVGSKPRTMTGLALRPPREVRRLWLEVRRARTRPAVQRRAQRFLEALLAYSRDANEATGRWRVIRDQAGRVVGRAQGGGGPIPTIVMRHMSGGTLGLYRSGFRSGWSITIDPEQPLDEVRATIVHEVLHALDHDARLTDAGHDRLWRLRLAALAAMFPEGQR